MKFFNKKKKNRYERKYKNLFLSSNKSLKIYYEVNLPYSPQYSPPPDALTIIKTPELLYLACADIFGIKKLN